MTEQQCVVCGTTGPDVAVALCHWLTLDEYTAEPRCKAESECRRTVEEQGKPWPLVERQGVVA